MARCARDPPHHHGLPRIGPGTNGAFDFPAWNSHILCSRFPPPSLVVPVSVCFFYCTVCGLLALSRPLSLLHYNISQIWFVTSYKQTQVSGLALEYPSSITNYSKLIVEEEFEHLPSNGAAKGGNIVIMNWNGVEITSLFPNRGHHLDTRYHHKYKKNVKVKLEDKRLKFSFKRRLAYVASVSVFLFPRNGAFWQLLLRAKPPSRTRVSLQFQS